MIETVESWRDELHSVVRPMVDRDLAEQGLPPLARQEFDFMVDFEPRPEDDNPLTWYREIKARAAGFARMRSERTTSRVVDRGRVTLDEPAPAEDPRWATLAAILAVEARDNPSVGNWRAHHLPPEGLLSREAAPLFLEQLEEKPRRWLEQIAASLVEWHGWWDPDEAALSVLTGDPGTGRRIRTNIIVRDRVGASRVIIEADPRASPQAVAESYRRARSEETHAALDLPKEVARHHKLKGARPHTVSAKNAALALHLARHRYATWGERRTNWNTNAAAAQPEWVYEADAAFARDAGRAWAQVVGEDFSHKPPAFRLPI